MPPFDLPEQSIAEKLRRAYATSGEDWPLPGGVASHDPEDLKCAAVLIPLVRFAGEWHLLYTRRADIVETHKGQVSFPGGACDPGEGAPEQTALREAREEIGLLPDDVRLLGRLEPMVTITSFRVSPVVGVVPWPYTFKVEYAEVARVFTIPLGWLSDPANRWEISPPDRDLRLILYHPYDGELLWGVTAAMTCRFLEVLGAD